MTVGKYIAEGAAYVAGFLLSCGPSQIFGLVKGGIDLVKLTVLQMKISGIGQQHQKGQKSLEMGNRDVSVRKMAKYEKKIAKYEASIERKIHDLKIDGLALIPFIGAITSWKVHAKDNQVTSTSLYDSIVKNIQDRFYIPLGQSSQLPEGVSVTSNQASSDIEPLIVEKDVENFEREIDAVEADWRANEKYHHVTSQIVKGLNIQLENHLEVSSLKTKLLAIQEGDPLDTSEKECQFYTAKALSALEKANDRSLFPNERAAYKEYKDFLRKALGTDFYKNDPNSTTLSKLLNMTAYVEFSQVNTQAFTESVSQKFTNKEQKTSENKASVESPIGQMREMLGSLESFHKSRKNEAEIGSTIRGEVVGLGLDSLVQGNPANLKFKVEDKNGNEIANIRTPTPTGKDGKVTAEFKAFLRHVKSLGQTYTMVNLQNRTDPGIMRTIFGFNGEYVRSRNLEALGEDPEFKDMFMCFTLDKNSQFFKQGDAAPKDFKEFKETFMSKLTDKKSGFFLPPSWHNSEKLALIESKLDMVHQTVFNGKEQLTQKERQDFIEIAYIFLADSFVKETGAMYYNESCKDCIDRGGGANWVMMVFLTILEAYDESRKHNDSPPLKERIDSLPAKFEEDAIWARKRPVTHERLERAESAVDRILDALEANPNNIKKWCDELNFKKIVMNPDVAQITKDPALGK